MKITIIIPVYNVAPYIEACLQSVMRQTYTGDMECLLIDDATPDESIGIAETLLKDYKGAISFRILHHEQNRGLSSARNTGIREATGDYLYFLDSDDTISDDCMEAMMNVIQRDPDTQLVQCNMQESTGRLLVTLNNVVRAATNAQTRALFYKDRLLLVNACNKLIKRSFMLDNSLFFREGIIYEDMLWTFHVLKHLSAVTLLPAITYLYVIHQNSIITGVQKAKALHNYSVIYKEIIDSLTPGYEKKEMKYYTVMFCSQFAYIDRTNNDYRQLSKLFWHRSRQYKSLSSLYLLSVTKVAVKFKYGKYIISLLNRLRLFPLKFA